jgi:hypothetical protein
LDVPGPKGEDESILGGKRGDTKRKGTYTGSGRHRLQPGLSAISKWEMGAVGSSESSSRSIRRIWESDFGEAFSKNAEVQEVRDGVQRPKEKETNR